MGGPGTVVVAVAGGTGAPSMEVEDVPAADPAGLRPRRRARPSPPRPRDSEYPFVSPASGPTTTLASAVSTVDDIELPAGRLALVLAVADLVRGRRSWATTASRGGAAAAAPRAVAAAMTEPSGVVALIAARNEAGRIGDTVRAVATLPEVRARSTWSRTARPTRPSREAREAGAWVLIARRAGWARGRPRGGAAPDPAGRAYLLLDGDLGRLGQGGRAAARAGARRPGRPGRRVVPAGRAPRRVRAGQAAPRRWLIRPADRRSERRRADERPAGPDRRVLDSVRPLAGGFGIEVAMTIDALRLGFRFLEVPVAMEHRYTGRDLAGFAPPRPPGAGTSSGPGCPGASAPVSPPARRAGSRWPRRWRSRSAPAVAVRRRPNYRAWMLPLSSGSRSVAAHGGAGRADAGPA